jgi:hypothetical protein
MLHGRHDRKSNAVTANATAPILCDQDEFGKAIGRTIITAGTADQSSASTLSKNE